jgi:hypothetical protein
MRAARAAATMVTAFAATSSTSMRAHRRVRLAGLLILAAGWIAAAFVFVAARHEEEAPEAGLSRSETFALERFGGKANARTVEFDRWLASLWHGERLAWTLAVLALAVGGSCLYVAGLMEETVEADGTRPPRA